MGNFSRNTFDPLKNYVAVRLQQGVPVLDADWNELSDVSRQELYDAFNLAFTDGIQPGGFDFEVGFRPEPNDFNILAGAALIQGRPVRVRNNLRYSTQPWTDPQRAARDGVAVIPPLTTPPGPPEGAPPRIDIVYLDVWDREVGSTEDANLINPAIGVETSVRLKREAAVRVAEGTTELPTAPAGHVFMPLALLRRPRNQAQITNIEDIRPFFHSPQGTRGVSFLPAFFPISSIPATGSPIKLAEWRTTLQPTSLGDVPKLRAVKVSNEAAVGVLPLILPDRARLSSFSMSGDISVADGRVQWQLLRISHQVADGLNARQLFDVLAEDTIRVLSGNLFGFVRGLSTTDPKLIVTNSRYSYALLVSTSATPAYVAHIDGISLAYQYYGLAGQPTHTHD
jgi:hypothetical protein